MKFLSKYLPLIYFMLLAAFWFADNYIELGIINYMAIAVIVVLLLQLCTNNRILGIGIGSAGLLFCGYQVVLACISFTRSTGESSLPFLLRLATIFGIGLALGALLASWHWRHKGVQLPRNKNSL